MAARFCPQCGHEQSSAAKFCTHCGAALTPGAAAPPPAPAVTRVDAAARGTRRLLLPLGCRRPDRPGRRRAGQHCAGVAAAPPATPAAPPLTNAAAEYIPPAPPLTNAADQYVPPAPPLTNAPTPGRANCRPMSPPMFSF